MEHLFVKELQAYVYFDRERVRKAETDVQIFMELRDSKGNPLYSPMRATGMAFKPDGPKIADTIREACGARRRDQKSGRTKRRKTA